MQGIAMHPRRTLAVLLAVAGLSLGVLVWLVMAPRHPAPARHTGGSSGTVQPAGPQATAVITITATGFVPRTLVVHPNTTVIWVNKDTMPHLPAADPYPSHASMPGLVAPRALGKDETYGFGFSRAAVVRYHDEVNPLLTGTIDIK